MVEISVIMYVYNDQIFLKESLNSLINQTFNDIEIICINDGSSDDSLSILEEYQQKYAQISIKTLEHTGLAGSLNKAFDEISGRYVYITNPGCILEENALESLHDKSEENTSAISVANKKLIDETDNSKVIKSFNKTSGEVLNHGSINDLTTIDTSTENKLILTNLIKENNIKFENDNTESFVYNLIFNAGSISYIQETLFTIKEYYTKLNNKNGENLFNAIPFSNNIIKIFRENDELEQYKQKLYDNKMSITLNGLNKISEDLKEEYFIKLREDYKEILLNDEFNEDFLENVSKHYRKFFEMVIISESYYEYELLKKTYYQMNDYYQLLIDRNYFKNAQEKMNKEKE